MRENALRNANGEILMHPFERYELHTAAEVRFDA